MILLHGAGLGGWIWDGVRPHLEVESEVIERNVHATIEQCADEVAARAEGKVIVGHSFAAQIALAAAAKTRAAAVVLIGGMVPEPGQSFLSLLPFPQRVILGMMLRRAKDGIALPKSLVRTEYCNDLDEETTRMVLERVTPEAPRLYLDPVHWGGGDARRFYIKLLNDKSVSPKKQDQMIARTGAQKMEVNLGHLPMLADPVQTAAMLNTTC